MLQSAAPAALSLASIAILQQTPKPYPLVALGLFLASIATSGASIWLFAASYFVSRRGGVSSGSRLVPLAFRGIHILAELLIYVSFVLACVGMAVFFPQLVQGD